MLASATQDCFYIFNNCLDELMKNTHDLMQITTTVSQSTPSKMTEQQQK